MRLIENLKAFVNSPETKTSLTYFYTNIAGDLTILNPDTAVTLQKISSHKDADFGYPFENINYMEGLKRPNSEIPPETH